MPSDNGLFLKDILKTLKVGKAKGEREDIIGQFQDEILKGWVGTRYYPKNEKAMAHFKKMVALYINMHPELKDTQDLYTFFSICKQSRIPFGAYFYWIVKPKKKNGS